MKKILIIEDNKDVRKNTADILELASYKVHTAENGKIGLEMAINTQPDLIICDIMMPELNGFDVLQNLSINKRTASIPFIFLTAKTEREDMRKGMNLGADDYLTKPFEEKELLDAITSRIKKHDFLRREFSRDMKGVNQFFDAVATHDGMQCLSKDRSPKKYSKKEFIFMEGDTARKLYLIQSGSVKTYKTTDAGKSLITGIYRPGQFIGQLSLLAGKGTYSDTASVLEKAEIIEIPKKDFITLLYGDPYISKKFIAMISNDVIDLQEQLVSMAFKSVRQRLAWVLLQLQSQSEINCPDMNTINIPREDLAGLIGTATETTIRMLSNFKEEGLVDLDSKRNIVVIKRADLEEIELFG